MDLKKIGFQPLLWRVLHEMPNGTLLLPYPAKKKAQGLELA
jgi:hypothetical protein